MQRRNRRAGVEDRWRRSDGSPAARAGKGRRWLARYVDDQGRENTRSFERKIDAQAWLNEITATQVTGTYVAPKAGRVTVGELHVKWLGTQGHLKETTVATRAFAWSGYVEVRWASVAAADVHSSDIRAWVQELATGGAKPATIENALSVLRQILEMAVDDRRIPRNPCSGVKSPKRHHRARGYLTHQQAELLLAGEVGDQATVVRFLAYSGLRWGEMAALRVESFDMLRRRVNIYQAVAEVGGRLVWSTPKSHEKRSVPFPAFLAEPLAAVMGEAARGLLRRQRRVRGCRLATASLQSCRQATRREPGLPDRHTPRSSPYRRLSSHQRRSQRKGRSNDARTCLRGAHARYLRRIVSGRLGASFGSTRRCAHEVAEICCGPTAD